MKQSSRSLLTALILLALAGCAQNPFEVTLIRCPAIASPAGANTLTFFTNSLKRQQDEIATVTISELRLECDQDDDEAVGTARFMLSARRGPELSADRITVRFFAGVLRDNSRIISKAEYATELVFDGADRAASEETIRVHMDNIDFARRYNYELLIGLVGEPSEYVYTLRR